MDSHFGDSSVSGDAVFDASQYAFFGNDVGEEIELGGMDDDGEETPEVNFDEEEFLWNRHDEGDDFISGSDIHDLPNTFFKSNTLAESKDSGFLGDRESSSTSEWMRKEESSNYFYQSIHDTEDNLDIKRWSSQPYSSSGQSDDSRPLYRTSSYTEQQPQQTKNHQNYPSEPVLMQNTPFNSLPLSAHTLQVSHNHINSSLPYHTAGRQIPLSPQPLHPVTGSQFQFNGLPPGSTRQSGVAQIPFPNSRPPAQWINQPGMYSRDHLLAPQNGLAPPPMMPQMHLPHHRMHTHVQPPMGVLPGMRPQLFNPNVSITPQMGDFRDPRLKSAVKLRQNIHMQGFDLNGHRFQSAWPQFRSKYMTVDEIETIVRIQLTATHSSDPYVDDYYHQAYLAKKNSGSQLKHHFCPTHLRDSSVARANNEPHAFLQVDALGRVPFSSIRRPRPLLEVDSPSSPRDSELKALEKPLEQEPMLAVRVTIEDTLLILLDVDDLDRFLDFNQLPDGGILLRTRRQKLLEEVASSLQLVDPLGKSGASVGLAPNDDLIFLRIASLSKGRKMLARYLQVISPSCDLMRVVCMAIFRHLRFLFGSVPSDHAAADSANKLAAVLSSCVRRMDLGSLSACLAAVVCSSEQPPLRPIGSPSGFGATLILQSVLERATELMNDPHDSSNYVASNHSLWKASFDEFFDLVIRYCINKYDSIMQSSLMDPAEAIRRELPLELLRASVPHTSEYQKKMLYDLSQRSISSKNGSNSASLIA